MKRLLKKRPRSIRIGPGPIESFVGSLIDLVTGRGEGRDQGRDAKVPVPVRPGKGRGHGNPKGRR